MTGRPRLHPATHPYIKRGHKLGMTYVQLARLFEVSPKRIQQIVLDVVRVKTNEGKWINQKRRTDGDQD